MTFPAIFYFFALGIPVLMFLGIISLNNIVRGIKFHCLSHPKLSIGHFEQCTNKRTEMRRLRGIV